MSEAQAKKPFVDVFEQTDKQPFVDVYDQQSNQPQIKNEKDKIRKSPDFSEIGKSAVEQGIFGLAAPEATYALGKGLTYIPYPPAKAAGYALQAGAPFVGRIGPAVAGFFGGATGEATGQLAETTKTTKPLADTARILGGFAIPTALSKSAAGIKNFLVGTTTDEAERLAKLAEKIGINLEPRQVRQDSPKGSPGFLGYASGNQTLINEEVSNVAGRKSKNVGPEYVRERLKDAGDSYSKIFGQELKVDRQLATDLQQMADFERSVRPSDVRTITAAADNITGKFTQAQQLVQTPISAVKVDGEVLQRLRSDLSAIARSSTDGNARRVAGQFIEKIDANIARNHKDLASKLQETNRQYAVAKALEDLNASGGISQGNVSLEQLGDYLSKNVYGYGSGTTKHPLFDLGEIGKGLKIRGRFEGVQSGEGIVGGTLSKLEQLLNLPGRLPIARSLQRPRPTPPTSAESSAITSTESLLEKKLEDRK
jgi:hypothetical protein